MLQNIMRYIKYISIHGKLLLIFFNTTAIYALSMYEYILIQIKCLEIKAKIALYIIVMRSPLNGECSENPSAVYLQK